MDSKNSELPDKPIKGDRIRTGLRRARAEGKRIGRPRVSIERELIIQLREDGFSWSQIARKTGAGAGTVRRAFKNPSGPSCACQNPPRSIE